MTTLRSLTPALLLVLALSACSSGDDQATDAAPTGASQSTGGSAVPEQLEQQGVPASPGEVRTQGPVTVIQQQGGRVEVCLGVTTMIYPPSCTGPAVEGWEWETSGQGMFTEEGGTRFGSYALVGTWDGEALTVTDAVPAALYDAAPVEPTEPPVATRSFNEAELAEIADEASSLPGATGAAPDGTGRVQVDVVYDDGSIQAYADRAWGEGVVVVSPALVDAV